MSNRTKRKLDKETTYEDLLEGWTQCCFLLKHKMRLCNLQRVVNSKYCGIHLQTEDPVVITNSSRRKGGESADRIPCPLDPTHSIFKRCLESHLKICNVTKNKAELESWPFYRSNCNGSDSFIKESINNLIDLTGLAKKVHQIYSDIRSEIEDDESKYKPEATEDYSAMDALIRSEISKDQSSFNQLRHCEQDIEIVHRMIEYGLLKRNDESVAQTNANSVASRNIYLEFGAGRGLLGFAVHLADQNALLGLVEKSSNKKKIDKFLTERKANFQRIRMDIRDCFIPGIPFISELPSQVPEQKTPIVAVIAKHLCGVASDLAIRSISHLHSPVMNVSVQRGLSIATCCHHACRWSDYTGQAWISSKGICEEEFDILKHWSGWASLERTVDTRKSSSEPPAVQTNTVDTINPAHSLHDLNRDTPRPDGISHEEMLSIGKKVKRIFDYGRVKYIQMQLGMKVSMVKYCDEVLSPECMLILASDTDSA